jgi:hypothetical protein
VHQPEASEPAAGSGIVSFKIGQEDGPRVSDYDVGYPALAVDEDTYLPSNFVRDFRKVSRDLLCHDPLRCDFAAVDALQAFYLISLEPESCAM